MSYFINCPHKNCIHKDVCVQQIKIEMGKAECNHYDNDASFVEKIGKKYMNIEKGK
jgi:hypothetical protein